MTRKWQRTHHCGELSDKNIEESVTLCGWVHTRRDHGGLIFIDLWDKEGLTQVVLNPQIDSLAHQHAQSLRGNYVMAVRGKVRSRPTWVRPSLSQRSMKTSEMFQSVTPENAEEVLKQLMAEPSLRDLARIAVTIFLLRFPTVESFVNKGHPLVLAMDEYMLENANAQNWQDYQNIAEEYSWSA